MKKLTIALLLLLSAKIANAAPMTNVWIADIKSYDSGGYAEAIFAGITRVSWEVLFDDENTEMHQYRTSGATIDELTSRTTPDYSFMSDAAILFDSTLTNFFSHSANNIEPEYFSTHAWAYSSTLGGQFSHYRNLADAYLFARSGGSKFSEYAYASIQTGINTHDTVYFSNLSITQNLSITTHANIPVPEPTTLLLFSLGTAFLGFRKKK